MTNPTSAESATTSTTTTSDADKAREERNRKQRERRAAKKDAAKATEKPKATPTEKPAETPVDPWKGKTPREVLIDYLKANVTADADAPNRLQPFIDPKGTLRMHSSDWREWLTDNAYIASKREAGAVLKDAGLVQKVYAIPGEDRSAGFHTGAAPRGTAELPRRVVERTRAPRNPLSRLTDEERAEVLAALEARPASPVRDALLELVK